MRRFLLIFLFAMGTVYAQQTQFFRTYGLGLFDVGECVVPVADTNYIVAGTTNTTGMNGTDLLLFKTNSIGDLIWWKNFGGNGIESGKSALMTNDSSGYLVCGYKNDFGSTGYDVWLLKTNLTGDTIWTKTYGGSDWEISYAINKLPDSTYIIAGETYSYGNGQRDAYVLRIDGNGDTLWTKTFGGSNDDVAKYIHIDRNENILIVGNTTSFGAGNSDVYLVYLDLNGDTMWTKTIGTAEDDFGYSADMYIDTSGAMNFVIGYTSWYSPDLAQNTYLLRIDSMGNSLSLYPQYESSIVNLDHPHVLQREPGKISFTADYQEAADQNSIIFLAKTQYNLVTIFERTCAGGVTESTFQNDFKKTTDNGFIITGYSENWGPGPTSCILLKLDTLMHSPDTPTISLEKLEDPTLQMFPNPVVGEKFYINSSNEIEWVDILSLNGELVHSFKIPVAQKSITLEKPFIASGIYLLEIKTTHGTIFRKIIF
jgi:hypothetical protein